MVGLLQKFNSFVGNCFFGVKVSSCKTPQIGFGDGTLSRRDLFQDPAFIQVLEILNEFNPILVSQLSGDVIPSDNRVQVESQKLQQLKDNLATLEAQKAKAEVSLQPLPSDLHIQENKPETTPYQAPWYYGMLTLGLSFMLLLGLNDITTGKQLRNIKSADYPVVTLNWLAASCMTLGIKQVMSKTGKQSFRYEPNRSFPDDRKYPDLVAWWLRYGKGDGGLWLGIVLISMETCFAAPGLIALLRPDLAAQLVYQVAMTATAGLAATTNVAFGWQCGVEEARHEYNQELEQKLFDSQLQELRDSKKEQVLVERNTELACQLQEAVALLPLLRLEIERQQKIVADARVRAQLENARWEREVKQWLQKHPEQIEQFNRDCAQEQKLAGNGHSLLPVSLDEFSSIN